MTLQNFRHGSLAGGPIILQTGWPHDPAKNYARWPHDPANRHSETHRSGSEIPACAKAECSSGSEIHGSGSLIPACAKAECSSGSEIHGSGSLIPACAKGLCDLGPEMGHLRPRGASPGPSDVRLLVRRSAPGAHWRCAIQLPGRQKAKRAKPGWARPLRLIRA